MAIKNRQDQMFNRAIILLALFLLTACTSTSAKKEEMYTLASALTKLSSAVEATVRYNPPSENLTDQQLLELATLHDPSLLLPFKSYQIQVKKENRHAIVLVCKQKDSPALLEDAGCSAEMDKNHWLNKPPVPCVFTLDTGSVCAQ